MTPGAGAALDADRLRAVAHSILEEKRFQADNPPQPFKGLLQRLGDLVAPVTDAVGDLFDRIAAHVAGGRGTLLLLLAAVILGLSALVTARILGRGRTGLAGGRFSPGSRAAAQDPRALEQAAEEAERRGDLEGTMLRFRAGLLRLDAARVITFRPSTATGEVSRVLRSPAFDGMARVFDEVVYGRRAAGAGDVAAVKDGWARVLQQRAA